MLNRPTPEAPGPGQLSVWDFPRPPAYVQWHQRVEIRFGGSVIASTTEAWCVLETSHPPAYYLPRSAFATGTLRRAEGSSYCEWKGQAVYYNVVADEQVALRAAWSYPAPKDGAEAIRDHVAVYPAHMDS